ncbi:MAG: universal stress protein [Thaumarchaeota archaeon]|jgi:nucleotide-binding universal stress UspA family protein|nr:universal stress protein [Candidatus Geocrenenecus arthurdayi]MCL7390428.1 universal stress protein [Candidatus Geocrenenecus arthurdayi]MCL7402787.1 universal stress protein [Candidatus Geocrenenecus arthurdayi]
MSRKTRYKILFAVKDYVNFKALTDLLETLTRDIEIVFLHIIEFPLSTPLYPEMISTHIEETRNKLQNLLDWAKAQGINADLRITASRDIVEAIISEAEKIDADMIVLQKSLKKIKRKIRRLARQTNLEKVTDLSKRIVVLLPSD